MIVGSWPVKVMVLAITPPVSSVRNDEAFVIVTDAAGM